MGRSSKRKDDAASGCRSEDEAREGDEEAAQPGKQQ